MAKKLKIICVHGTFAGPAKDKDGKIPSRKDACQGADWWQEQGAFIRELTAKLRAEDGEFEVEYVAFVWTGDNSHVARMAAGASLLNLIRSHTDDGTVHIIGHSHGGVAIWHALVQAVRENKEDKELLKVGSWTTLGTPFVHLQPIAFPYWALISLILPIAFARSSYDTLDTLVKSFSVLRQDQVWPLLIPASIAAILLMGFLLASLRTLAAWGMARYKTNASTRLTDETWELFRDRWLPIYAKSDEAILALQIAAGGKGSTVQRLIPKGKGLVTQVIFILSSPLNAIFGPALDQYFWAKAQRGAFGIKQIGICVGSVYHAPVRHFPAAALEVETEQELETSALKHAPTTVRALRNWLGELARISALPEDTIQPLTQQTLASTGLIHNEYYKNSEILRKISNHIKGGTKIELNEHKDEGNQKDYSQLRFRIDLSTCALVGSTVLLTAYAMIATRGNSNVQLDEVLNKQSDVLSRSARHTPLDVTAVAALKAREQAIYLDRPVPASTENLLSDVSSFLGVFTPIEDRVDNVIETYSPEFQGKRVWFSADGAVVSVLTVEKMNTRVFSRYQTLTGRRVSRWRVDGGLSSVSEDGKVAVVKRTKGGVAVVETSDGKSVISPECSLVEALRRKCAFSFVGRVLVVYDINSAIMRSFDPFSGKDLGHPIRCTSIRGAPNIYTSVTFSSGGRYALITQEHNWFNTSAKRRSSMELVDVLSRKSIRRFNGYRYAEFASGGKLILLQSSEGPQIKQVLWDPAQGRPVRLNSGDVGIILSFAVSADEKWIAIHTADSQLVVFQEGREVFRMSRAGVFISFVGNSLLSFTDAQERMRFRALESGREIDPLEFIGLYSSSFVPAATKVNWFQSTSDGILGYIELVSEAGRISASIWNLDAKQGSSKPAFPRQRFVHQVGGTDAIRRRTGSSDDLRRQTEAVIEDELKNKFSIKHPWILERQPRFIVSEDLSRVAAIEDQEVVVWDAKLGGVLGEFTEEDKVDDYDRRTITCLSFSPDGRMIVTGSHLGTVRLWSLQSNELIATFRSGWDRIVSATIASSGQELLVLDDHGRTTTYPIDQNAIAEKVRRRLQVISRK